MPDLLKLARLVGGAMRDLSGAAPSQLRLPTRVGWHLDESGSGLTVEVPASFLSENIQNIHGAAVAYAVGAAYWLEHHFARRWTVRFVVSGDLADPLHANRSRYLLHRLQDLLHGRLVLQGVSSWDLPRRAVVNSPTRRDPPDRPDELRTEHQIEVYLSGLDDTPIGRLHRQFPLGVFRGKKGDDNRVLPGNKAQIDLWSYDEASRTLNLVELKSPSNRPLGILTEALLYLLLLDELRRSPSATWSTDWPGSRAAKSADRMVMWLVCGSYHPLVHWHGRGLLEWLSGPLSEQGLGVRLLPYAVTADNTIEWQRDPTEEAA